MKSLAKFVISIFLISSFSRGDDVPTLFPTDPFDPAGDAKKLSDAFGTITDDNAIIDVMCKRVSYQRAIVTETYNNGNRRNLVQDMNRNLVGSFQNICVKLTYATSEYLAMELQIILSGLIGGIDDASLIEILMSRSNRELAEIRDFYQQDFGHSSLISDIQKKTSGSYQELLVLLAEGTRDESTSANVVAVGRDVDSLYNAAQGRPEGTPTNDSVFIEIFGGRSWAHLSSVLTVYLTRYNFPMETVIREEFDGEFQTLLMSILEYARSSASYFATHIFLTLFGPGSRDDKLIRLIASRCEIDLENIKGMYEVAFARSLVDDISSETCCSFRTALLTLLA